MNVFDSSVKDSDRDRPATFHDGTFQKLQVTIVPEKSLCKV